MFLRSNRVGSTPPRWDWLLLLRYHPPPIPPPSKKKWHSKDSRMSMIHCYLSPVVKSLLLNSEVLILCYIFVLIFFFLARPLLSPKYSPNSNRVQERYIETEEKHLYVYICFSVPQNPSTILLQSSLYNRANLVAQPSRQAPVLKGIPISQKNLILEWAKTYKCM